jgi:hypothetical protein
MTSELANFAARLRESIGHSEAADGVPAEGANAEFSALALELFALQFAHNAPYRTICEARGIAPERVDDWTGIPAVPASAFKALDLSCIPAGECTTVFHSSGTTGQRPSRHFHNAKSLEVYEASVWPWFRRHLVPDLRFTIYDLRASATRHPPPATPGLLLLTPEPAQARHSSLVYMFETVRRRLSAPDSAFVGTAGGDGSWTLDGAAAEAVLRRAVDGDRPLMLLGTAFSFVHLLDYLEENGRRFRLPGGSRVMETGGYKGRSRQVPKSELHSLLTGRLGIPADRVVCEYGMSELSSQAYDWDIPEIRNSEFGIQDSARVFRFPPWARARVVSPETGDEVGEGESGLLRLYDLANVYSVMAIQTEDLAVRRGNGFELLGRSELLEPRGCSLLAQDS